MNGIQTIISSSSTYLARLDILSLFHDTRLVFVVWDISYPFHSNKQSHRYRWLLLRGERNSMICAVRNLANVRPSIEAMLTEVITLFHTPLTVSIGLFSIWIEEDHFVERRSFFLLVDRYHWRIGLPSTVLSWRWVSVHRYSMIIALKDEKHRHSLAKKSLFIGANHLRPLHTRAISSNRILFCCLHRNIGS